MNTPECAGQEADIPHGEEMDALVQEVGAEQKYLT